MDELPFTLKEKLALYALIFLFMPLALFFPSTKVDDETNPTNNPPPQSPDL